MKEIELRYTQPQLDIFFSEDKARHVMVQKGRRFGATKGAANACIEWLVEGQHILWGDTIHSNINKYFERYFLPELKANKIDFEWAKQERTLKVGNGHIDFRSADNPENWEGFGYSRIILNEAGIILSNPYLYTNAVRPMMLDHSDAVLYALGVPKGKVLKDGTEHPFYTLCKKKGQDGYRVLEYSSYDNPLLKKEDIDQLELDMSMMDKHQVRQEIYGEFIDRAAGNEFAFNWSDEHHIKPCYHSESRQLIISMDFNIEPFAFIYSHVWQDKAGFHCHIFMEETIEKGSVHQAVANIRHKFHHYLWNCVITGDYNGNKKELGQSDNASNFEQIRRELGLSARQIQTSPNPKHSNSRNDLNFVLFHSRGLPHDIDFRIDPRCPNTIRDMKFVEADGEGGIVKTNRKHAHEKADHLDAVRYLVNHDAVQKYIRYRQKLYI